jgi:hypothetical protein
MQRIVLALIFIVIGHSEGAGQVLVNLRNQTKENFRVFNANIMGRNYTFSNFKAGQTRKILVDTTYPYFLMEAITAKDTVRFQPIDFVGEPLYYNGRIILTLTFFERNGKRYLNKRTKRVGGVGINSDPLP